MSFGQKSIGVLAAGREDARMKKSTITMTGRSLEDVSLVVREARRLVGLERSYSCSGCGSEHRSWTRLPACPDCGDRLRVAVIRRAALA